MRFHSSRLVKPLFAVAALITTTLAIHAADGVKITEGEKSLRVEVNGKLFTEYHFKDVARPYFYPIIGPTGAGMTRNYPMKKVDGEETDHPHHRGLWYGHRSVNGVSFWEETGKEGKITHDKFLELKNGKEVGIIKEQTKWISTNGSLVCTDVRTIRIHNSPSGPMLDFEITISAPDTEVVFGDDKDGTMATRITETMRLSKPKVKGQKKAAPGDGHIVLSTGVRDADTWGKRAEWCDYYGPVEGKTVGVAIFDHPSNPRYPTWWHVREYGLFAANPFGKRNFEKLDDKEAGAMKIAPHQSASFRYRFYWHEGDEKTAKVAQHYADYIAGSKK